MQSELAISEDAVDDRSEAWSVLLGPARLLLTAVARLKAGAEMAPRMAQLPGEQLTKICVDATTDGLHVSTIQSW